MGYQLCSADCLNMGCPVNMRNNMDYYSCSHNVEDFSTDCGQYKGTHLEGLEEVYDELDFSSDV